MATISKYRKKNGELSYQATVRVKQGGVVVFSATRSFPKEALARDWARRTEVEAASPDFVARHKLGKLTLGDLLSGYLKELDEAGALGRTKGYMIELLLRCSIADIKIADLTAGDVVEHCQARRAGGTGPATIAHDVSALRTALDYAKRIMGLPVSTAPVDDAYPTLFGQTLVSKSRRRERRPTEDELARLCVALEKRQSQRNSQIPHVDILKFAVASCMRQGEIGRIMWADVDESKRCVLIRERKDPSSKYTNDQLVPLLGEAWEILQRQPRLAERIFPYNMDSVRAAFELACKALGIDDLRFHDMRHHGISKLFEQGLHIQEVAIVSGHKSWNSLRRYTQLRPESLHDKIATPAPAVIQKASALVVGIEGCLFMDGFERAGDVAAVFDLGLDDLEDVRLLLAGEFGDLGAVVVFEDSGALWWVYCQNSERVWLPEAIGANRLRHRLATGRAGRRPDGTNLFAKQLLEVLAEL